MSFTRFLESKKRPTVQLSLDNYREELEREVYDSLLDPVRRDGCFLTHLAEVMDLRPNLVRLSYPKTEELLMAIAAREPVKIKRAHEQFVAWGRDKDPDRVAAVESSLFECRSYLYGKEVEFSKEVADKIVEAVAGETEKNAERIVQLIEQAINRVHNWRNSSVIFRPLKPDHAFASNEGMVLVGQPPSMTFMCNNKPLGIELYDIQDVDGYPISIQEDYTSLLRALQVNKPRSAFQVLYVMANPKDRHKYEHIKREISLGISATLPTGSVLQESPPDHPEMDIWRVKVKNNKVINESSEAPIRWIELYKKAE